MSLSWHGQSSPASAVGRRVARVSFLGAALFAAWTCASPAKESDGEGARGGGEGSSDDVPSKKEMGDALEGARRSVTVSLSNNGATSRAINIAKIREIGARAMNGKDPNSQMAYLSTQWMTAAPTSQTLKTAQNIVRAEMQRNIQGALGEEVKLELAVSAVREKKMALAEHFLSEIAGNRQRNIAAGALNLRGVIAMFDGQLPEATDYWRQALKIHENYEPALFNLGMMAAKYGDGKTAVNALARIEGDWYAESGLIPAHRAKNSVKTTERICQKLTSDRGGHGPTALNCGIYEYQDKRAFDPASVLLRKAQANNSSIVSEAATKALDDLSRVRNLVQQASAGQARKAVPATSEGGQGSGGGTP